MKTSLNQKIPPINSWIFSLITLLSILSTNLYAQSTANYAFTTNTTGSLALDANGNTVDMSTGTTQVLTTNASQDQSISPAAIAFPAGFDFYFAGNRFTSYFASSNGIVQLGNTAVITGGTYTAGAGTLAAPRFSAFDGDLGTGTAGGIFGKLVGTAPNRCYVIEFRNMTQMWTNAYANDGTFQIRFYETTGVVEYVYGSMFCTNIVSASDATPEVGFSWGNAANQSLSVDIATSATDISGTMIQNTLTSGANIPNLHSTANGSRRVYSFTPSATNIPSGLTFSAVTQAGMTLNWTDNATDELGYAIYRSTDGVNYVFVSQQPASTVTYAATGLGVATTYFWKVYAVREALSTALTGSQLTLSGTLSGIKTVGATGDYANLTTAFADINAQQLTGNVELQLIAGYPAAPETYPILSSNAVSVGPFQVKVYPTVSGLSITSANTTGTLNLNNGANITFDGRVNQTGANDLVISNTNAGASYAVQFVNDAKNNTLTHCIVQSANNSNTSGTIVIGTTTGTDGNDNNTIDNCDIRDAATTPVNAIYGVGTTTTMAQFNDNVTISNNNISNFFNATTAGNGILAGSGSNAWTITNNKLFQTTARTYTSAMTNNAIQVNHTNGNGFVITGNTIGYSSSAGTGTYAMSALANLRFVAINVSAGTTTASSVQGNTITALSISTTASNSSGNGILAGINITNGNVNVGTITPNVIGSGTGTGAISSTSNVSAGLTVGINSSSLGVVNISNNIIGSINATGSAATASLSITGILVTVGTPTINGNTIGSTVTPNSINSVNVATTGSQLVRGIDVNSSNPTLIQSNTIANLNQNGTTTTAHVRGILFSGSGLATISQNTIYNLSAAATNLFAVSGITHGTGVTGGATISRNTIYSLSATATTATAINVTGINYNGPTAGSITGNRIYDLRNASTMATATTPPTATGILIQSFVTSTGITNNMISLGDAQSTNTEFIGIWNTSTVTGTINAYHNSISISGTAGAGALPTYGFLRGNNAAGPINTAVDIRNNIISNVRTGGTGKHYAIANQSAAASTTGWGLNASNYNLLNANAATVGLWGATDETFNAWRVAASSDANSISGLPLTFVDVPTADLHLNMGATATPIESGGILIPAVTIDYDNDVRPGPAGSVNGGATAPDMGADEFDGVPALPVITLNSVTPPTSTQCNTTARLVSVEITTPVGTIINASIGYTANGVAQTPITMTNTTGATWEGTIPVVTPVNATIAWGISATNSSALTGSYIGTPYSDAPLFGTTGSATATPGTVCANTNTVLTAGLIKTGSIQMGVGSTVSSNAPAVTPFYGGYGGVKTQYLIKASELTAAGLAAGNITSLSMNVFSAGVALSGFAINVENTALTVLTTNIESINNQVYSSASYTPTVGVNTFTFSSPVLWDGTSNLIVSFCWSNNNTSNTATTVLISNTSFVSGNARYVDSRTSAEVCSYTGSSTPLGWNGASTTVSSRPNFTFTGNVPPAITAISWSDGVSTVGTTNPLTVTPAATTTYTATITALGCTVTPAPTTTVTVTPLPSSPTPTNSAQCGVQIPTASVTSTTGATTPTFHWYDAATGGTLLQNSTSTTYTTAISATTTFYVSEVGGTGCESPRTAVTVNVSTPDPVSLTSSSAAICIGQSVTLTAANTAAVPFQNYTYSTVSVTTGSGAETPVTGASVTITPTIAGTYTYALSAVDGGCTATATANVTVNALPAITTATATPATVCSDSPIALTATSLNVTAGTTAIGTQTTTEFGGGVYRYGFGPGDFRHQLIFTAAELNAAGLQAGNITALSFNVTTVGSGSANNYTIKMGPTAATALTATFLTAPVSTVYTAATYTAVSGINTHTFSTPFNWNGTSNILIDICYNVSVTGGSPTLAANTPPVQRNTNLLGSVGACTATTGTTYTNRPLVSFSGQVGTNLTATLDWLWTPGTGLNTAAATTSVTNTTAGTLTQAYTVTATHPTTGCVNTAVTSAVTINPATIAPVAANSTQCGAGVPTASVTGSGTPGNTFAWFTVATGGTAIAGETGNTLTAYSVNATTTFYVSESNGTCLSARTPVTVTVTTPPAVTIAGTATICLGETTVLTASSVNDPDYTYTWSGGLGTGATVNASPTTNTTYTVTAVDASGGANNGCSVSVTYAITVNPIPSAVTATSNDNTICIGEAVNLSSSANSNVAPLSVSLLSQNFDAGMGTWTTVNNSTAPAITEWAVQNAPYSYNGFADFTNFSTPQGGGFALSMSDAGAFGLTTDSKLISPVFSTVGMTSATLTFQNLYRKLDATEIVLAEISTDGGTSWATLRDYQVLGSQGTTTNNAQVAVNESISLAAAYLNQPNVRIRFNYISEWGYYWLIDNVVVTGQQPTPATYAWTSSPAGFTSSVQNPTGVSPLATTTYTVTASNSFGCSASASTTITVNALPTVSAGADQAVCAGTPVTLTGSGATTYTWNNSVTNNVAFTPSATATYTVTGTDVNGCQNTDQAVVTVNPLPAVNAGADQAVCAGGSVTLTGTGVGLTWDNGVTDGVAFTPIATTTYTLTANDGTCTNTDAVVVTVNALPTVSAGADIASCTGLSVTLNGSGATTYTWDNSVTNGVAFVPAATTTYTVTGTDVNGCQNTDAVIVTVNTLPTVSAGADQTVCAGSSVTLAGSGATTYTWNNGVTNNVAFAAPATTTTYTVTGTDVNGCQNTDQAVVNVNALPAVNAGSDVAVCTGGSVTLTGTGVGLTWDNGVTDGVAFTPIATTTYTLTANDGTCTNTDAVVVTVNALPAVSAGADIALCTGLSVTLNGSGAASYAWNNGVTNGVAFVPGTTTTYTVTGTDVNGCINTDAVVVTVNALPTVSAGADQTVCAGTPVTLAGSGASTYTWNNGVTNNVAFAAPATTTTYTVTGTDVNGCQNTDQAVVNVNALPTVNAGADQTVCSGNSVTLTATGTGPFTWNNSVVNGVAFVPTATTTYTVTVNNGTCSNTDAVTVTVNPTPVATTTLSGVTITASAGTSYQWIDCATNQPITGATSQAYTATANGSYAVIVTNASGCSATSPCVTITTVGIKEHTDVTISVSPNPTNSDVTVKMSSETAFVEVTDAQGKILQVITISNGGKVDLSTYDTGVYFLRIKTDAGSAIERIVKN